MESAKASEALAAPLNPQSMDVTQPEKGDCKREAQGIIFPQKGFGMHTFLVLCAGLISTPNKDRVELEKEQKRAN